MQERPLWVGKRPAVFGKPRYGDARQKPPPLCGSDGRSLADRFQMRIQPVESAGNASAKAVAARRYPNEVERKGARARQSRARKLAVQRCRGCKLRQLCRISFTASWRTALGCRRWRQSVVSAERGGGAALSGAAGRRRLPTEGGATILKVWSFQYLVLLQRLAQRGGRGCTGPPPADLTVDGVWLPMCDRGRSVCAGQAHHVA